MKPIIEGRPEFGNAEHIKALKLAEAKEAWKSLPPCPKCDGEGERECDECGHIDECVECDGLKKDVDAVEGWKKDHPAIKPWEVSR